MISTEKAMKAITKLGFHPFDAPTMNAVVCVSAEHGDIAADYYGEFTGYYPWINPKLESFAKKHGCYWEWVNPGLIALYEA